MMLGGAYSKTYKAIEQQQVEHLKHLNENHHDDAIARAKKLQLETNRRRKAQAVKRKLEAQREEKRRQSILNRRREEQREATEKFQRSHVSSRPSSKTSNSSSGKRSPKQHRTLEETLKLVRGSLSGGKQGAKHHSSPFSTQLYSPDPLNRPYVNKYSTSGHQSADKHHDNSQNYLHNNSLRNLNNSRSLFEQQLEKQQQLLVDQQQRTLNEFNDAIKQEIAKDRGVHGFDVESGNQNIQRSESLSSVDSLEDSEDSLRRSCDLTNNNDNEPTVTDTNQQFINKYSTRNDLSSINGHHSGYDRNIFEHKQGSPINIVPPYRAQDNGHYQAVQNNIENGYKRETQTYVNGKIDSYDINSTVSNNVPVAENSTSKPAADRPKVQLRAWATPSPVDSSHRQQQEIVSQNSSRMVTNSNLYTQRSTLTNVTSTTAFTKGTNSTGQQYTQSNTNITNGNSNDHVTNGVGMPKPQVVTLRKPSETSGRNLEFLETVTNDIVSDRSDQTYEDNTTTSTRQEPPPSRVPRPVTVVKKVIPSKQIAVPSSPTTTIPSSLSNQIITSAKTTSTPVTQPIVVLSVSKVDTKGSEQKYSTSDPNVPKLQVLPGSKLSVLPDKPVMTPKQFSGQGQLKQSSVQDQSQGQPKPTISKHKAPASQTQKSKDDSELETVSKAKLEDMDSGKVKGILKRPGISKLPVAGTMKRAGSTGSMNIKDSLEVAKSQLLHEKEKHNKPKKKSVRFADLRYSDDAEEEMEDEDKLFTKRIAVHITPKKRPYSAKPNLQTNETETTVKPQSRVSSAGSQKHKSTIRPQATAHIITHNTPVGNKENTQPDKRVSFVNNNFMSKVPVTNSTKNTVSQFQPASTEVTIYTVPGARLNYATSPSVSLPQKQEMAINGYNQQPTMSNAPPSQGMTNGMYLEGPVYDENGMRIDRTPTDDEINFLWDKVRTCLQRTPAPANSPVSDPVKPPFFEQPTAPRQAAQVSHTIIDGAALGQMASQARITTYNNSNLQSGRKSADPNGYQRRHGLLQRQKQQNPYSLNKGGNNSPSQQPQQQQPQQREIITYHGPMNSNLEPQQGNPQYQPRQDLGAGDSMTAFLMAEQLAQQSMSESQINHTINDVQGKPISANRPAPNVPSALSIEERRLLESLDKLNDQLKISEFPGPLPQQAPPPQQAPSQHQAAPKPQHYVHTGGFRGKQPITQRRNSGGTRRLVPASPTIQNFRFS